MESGPVAWELVSVLGAYALLIGGGVVVFRWLRGRGRSRWASAGVMLCAQFLLGAMGYIANTQVRMQSHGYVPSGVTRTIASERWLGPLLMERSEEYRGLGTGSTDQHRVSWELWEAGASGLATMIVSGAVAGGWLWSSGRRGSGSLGR